MGAPANATKSFRPGQKQSESVGKAGDSSSHGDKSKLKCSHCGMSKHNKEICFQLVGYPEWWKENHKPKEKRTTSNMVNNATTGRTDKTFTGRIGATGRHETTYTSDSFQSQFGPLRGLILEESIRGAHMAASVENPSRARERVAAAIQKRGSENPKGYLDGDDHWVWH